ncbi:MAG: hypothetical protein CEO12_526 [Parcubacteria group bacterium Gr01-1014_46]|nr:MAG: hypothetical protein CEO12_526 [Parcubacteria group bacterium Gr01-1014_46]
MIFRNNKSLIKKIRLTLHGLLLIIFSITSLFFFNPKEVQAAPPTITFMDSGGDATGGFDFYDVTTGAVAVDNTIYHTGTRSLKGSTGNPAVNGLMSRSGILSDTGRRISAWVYFDTAPVAQSNWFQIFSTSANMAQLQITTGRKLSMLGPTGNTVLATNTWYRISIAYVITSLTEYEFRIYLNGALELVVKNAGALGGTGSDRLRFLTASAWGTDINVWYDDIYVDSGTDLSDPGDVRVTAKKPAANNTNNFDTAIGANPSNRWTNVNEVATSTTNGWQHSASSDVQENYTLEARHIGDVDLTKNTIIGRTAWIYAKGTAGGAGTPKIMDNGTETAITLTSIPALFTLTSTDSSYPSNAAGIGIRSTADADDTFLYEAGTLIAYYANKVNIKVRGKTKIRGKVVFR